MKITALQVDKNQTAIDGLGRGLWDDPGNHWMALGWPLLANIVIQTVGSAPLKEEENNRTHGKGCQD